jgi:hypothetical protein
VPQRVINFDCSSVFRQEWSTIMPKL